MPRRVRARRRHADHRTGCLCPCGQARGRWPTRRCACDLRADSRGDTRTSRRFAANCRAGNRQRGASTRHRLFWHARCKPRRRNRCRRTRSCWRRAARSLRAVSARRRLPRSCRPWPQRRRVRRSLPSSVTWLATRADSTLPSNAFASRRRTTLRACMRSARRRRRRARSPRRARPWNNARSSLPATRRSSPRWARHAWS